MQFRFTSFIWSVRICSLMAVTACTSLPANEFRVAPLVQQPDELGRLPVGIIQSSVEQQQDQPRKLYQEGLVPGVFPLVTAAASAAAKKPDSIFKYQVALKSGEMRTIESPTFFKPGECIAIRVARAGKGTEIISAIPGACE